MDIEIGYTTKDFVEVRLDIEDVTVETLQALKDDHGLEVAGLVRSGWGWSVWLCKRISHAPTA